MNSVCIEERKKINVFRTLTILLKSIKTHLLVKSINVTEKVSPQLDVNKLPFRYLDAGLPWIPVQAIASVRKLN